MRVLVTGGTGSIGVWLVHRLVDEGHHPIVLDNKIETTYLEEIRDQITLLEGDVRDRTALSSTMSEHGVDRVAHLAKIVGRRGERNPLRALEVNVLGTGNVLGAADENDVDRVVFTSSKSVFAEITGEHGPPEFEPITEDYPKFDRDAPGVPVYSTTNKMAEYFGIRYAMDRDLDLVITRFGANYGPGKVESLRKWHPEEDGPLLATASFWANEMTNRALEGKSTRIATDSADNYVYTKDLAQGVARAVLSDDVQFTRNHREFLFDGGTVASLSEFAEEITRQVPAVDVSVGDGGIEIASNRSSACSFDISRARAELGYEPEYDVADAVEDFIRTKRRAET